MTTPETTTPAELSSTTPDADGWIAWSRPAKHMPAGSEAPVPPRTQVELRLRNGNLLKSRIALWCNWGTMLASGHEIVAYRLVGDDDGWIPWPHPSRPPYDAGTWVEIQTRGGERVTGSLGNFSWGPNDREPEASIECFRLLPKPGTRQQIKIKLPEPTESLGLDVSPETSEKSSPVSVLGRPGVGVWIKRAKPDWRSQSMPDLRAGDRVEVKFRHGKHTEIRDALSFDWRWKDDEHDIVSYRIVAPGPAEEPANDLRVSPTGGVKASKHKRPIHLLPFDALEATADVLDFGARKYSARNWERGLSTSDLVRAAVGHLWDWFFRRNGGRDPETGLSHLAHASCSVLFLLAHELRKLPDDRPSPVSEVPKPDTTNWPEGGA